MKTPLSFQVVSTKPFSDGKFLNFVANGPQGQFEGICWEQADHGRFYPGAPITVAVGSTKAEGAFWNQYKGKNRLEIGKGAEWTAAAAPAAQAQPAAQYTNQPATTAPAASYGPPAGYTGDGYGKGEDIMIRCAQLARAYADALIQHGFDQRIAEEAAARVAGTQASTWWFGERSC